MNKLELIETANEVRKGHRYCSSQCKIRTSGWITVSSRHLYISVF